MTACDARGAIITRFILKEYKKNLDYIKEIPKTEGMKWWAEITMVEMRKSGDNFGPDTEYLGSLMMHPLFKTKGSLCSSSR